MSKKKRARQQQPQRPQQAPQQRGRQRQRQNSAPRSSAWRGITASKVFIALIVLFVAVAAAVSVFSGSDGRPSCPPGQVWSDAHNHCH
ncbi:hypothetical protein BH23GEM9_BH23GEM9_19980 [soil metagenome]